MSDVRAEVGSVPEHHRSATRHGGLVGAASAGILEAAPHRLYEFIGFDRLAQDTSKIHRGDGQLWRGGHDDHRNLPRLGATGEFEQDVISANHWEREIQQNQIRCRGPFHTSKRFPPVTRFTHVEPSQGQGGVIHPAKVAVVLDNKDRRARIGHVASYWKLRAARNHYGAEPDY